MSNVKLVREMYQKVVGDVIDGVREAFLDEGCDEQVLHELKQMWESRLMQSKAIEDTPKPHVDLPAEPVHAAVPQPQMLQQSPVHRVAPPAHQHHQQPAVVPQLQQATVPQVAGQPMAQMLNLRGQLVALAPHTSGAVQPGGLAIASADQFGQPMAHFLVSSAANQLLLQAPGHIVQRPTQQIYIDGQTFTIASAPPQQLAMRPVDPKSVTGKPDGVIQLDGAIDDDADCSDDSAVDMETNGDFICSNLIDTGCRTARRRNNPCTSTVDI